LITDNFVLLNEPRRPWLDPELLKQKFLALSVEVHPDRVHTAPEPVRQAAGRRYTELNAAYSCLREPRARLRHLLELERGSPPDDLDRVPPTATDFFFDLGRLCKQADGFLAEKARVQSPLLKVQLLERGQEWADKLLGAQRELAARREELDVELRSMNPAWEAASQPGAPRTGLALDRLEQIYRALAYLNRWSEEAQKRVVQLSL
jgi:curved DNA-binding protein CbpA